MTRNARDQGPGRNNQGFEHCSSQKLWHVELGHFPDGWGENVKNIQKKKTPTRKDMHVPNTWDHMTLQIPPKKTWPFFFWDLNKLHFVAGNFGDFGHLFGPVNRF